MRWSISKLAPDVFGERGDNDVFHDLSPKFLESVVMTIVLAVRMVVRRILGVAAITDGQ